MRQKTEFTNLQNELIEKYKKRNPDIFEILKEHNRIYSICYLIIKPENLKMCPLISKYLKAKLFAGEGEGIPESQKTY